MTTRVTTKAINENILNYLNTNLSNLTDKTSEVSSGKKVNSVSDDVTAGETILSTTKSLSDISTYQTNITSATSELNTTDTALSSVSKALESIYSLVVQASNATYNADNLAAIEKEIQSYKDTIVSLANTEYAGKYIFSGTATSTETYTTASDGTVTYNGTLSGGEWERKTQISDGVTVTTNANGEDIFGYSTYTDTSGTVHTGKGLFETLDKISSLLTAAPPDHAAISSMIDNVDSAISTITNTRTKLAGVSNRLDMAKNLLTDAKTNYTSVLSGAQDIDYAKSVSALTAAQTAYEASLSASSKIMGLSLLNYL